MKIAAVICEYNPFHNGHKYQLEAARKITSCDAVVALMSGSFVQRGDFAVFPKEARAEIAMQNGADIIIENPAIFTLRSAEGYASAAVYTLASLNCIDYLFFGAECGEIEKLKEIADVFVCETDEFKAALAAELEKGLSFAAARSKAAAFVLGSWAETVLAQPNNLLAIEYLKALKRLNSAIEPVLIQRVGTGHNSDFARGGFASASYIRDEILNKNDVSGLVPNSCGCRPFENKRADSAVMAALALTDADFLARIDGISEGLENKIKTEVMRCKKLDELALAVKSKRYAYSRIKRALLCAYLGITKEDGATLPKYIKPLMFNSAGQAVLSKARKIAALPIAKSASPILKNEKAMSIWKRELEFERVYKLFYC